MSHSKTHFEQVPLEAVKKLAVPDAPVKPSKPAQPAKKRNGNGKRKP
jgi:hypothetical protein